jgi:uncharacterized protein YlxW (UPF0749 family)
LAYFTRHTSAKRVFSALAKQVAQQAAREKAQTAEDGAQPTIEKLRAAADDAQAAREKLQTAREDMQTPISWYVILLISLHVLGRLTLVITIEIFC